MTQLSRDDLKIMSPAEIDKAHAEGRCDEMLGMPAEYIEAVECAKTGTIGAHHIKTLADAGRHDLINKAHTEGRVTLKENR